MQKLQIRRGIHGKVLWRNNLMEIYYLSALFGAVIGFLLGRNITRRQQSTGNTMLPPSPPPTMLPENTGYLIVDGRLANCPFPWAAVLV